MQRGETVTFLITMTEFSTQKLSKEKVCLNWQWGSVHHGWEGMAAGEEAGSSVALSTWWGGGQVKHECLCPWLSFYLAVYLRLQALPEWVLPNQLKLLGNILKTCHMYPELCFHDDLNTVKVTVRVNNYKRKEKLS